MCAKPNLCLVGAGGHGRVVAAQLRTSNGIEEAWSKIVFCDGGHELGSTIDGHEVGFERVEDIRDAQVLVTVGNNGVRARLQARAEALGLHITTYTSHRAHLVTQEELGAGSVVLAGAVVNWAARLGKGVIIGSAAVVEHDAQVDDFVHVSPGAVLAGGARVGKGCFIGVNASVVAQVTLADGVTLGAGAVAVEDLREPGVYAGSPARRVD